MNTTQQHLLISDIKDDILILKNGGGALVLQVSAVNFGLLSEREQIAIISAFAQMLNSLSFSIQIVIYSERLNISSYLTLLEKAQLAQTNPLLSRMIGSYRQFIQTTIKENDVLDKKFFLVVPLFPLELGIAATRENLERKIKTILLPRRDQVVRQLNRVGLKAAQLTHQKLIELYYNIYNGQTVENITRPVEVSLKQPAELRITQNQVRLDQKDSESQNVRQPENQTARPTRNHPFVVEELE